MPIIKLVNEENHTNYRTPEDLNNLLQYVFNFKKMCKDSANDDILITRAIYGCIPFSFPDMACFRSDLIYYLMCINNNLWGKNIEEYAKHRVISFQDNDIRVSEVRGICKDIALFYARQGYIAAYAVHVNSKNIHVHFVVDPINYMNGNLFSVSYEVENLYQISKFAEREVKDLRIYQHNYK